MCLRLVLMARGAVAVEAVAVGAAAVEAAAIMKLYHATILLPI